MSKRDQKKHLREVKRKNQLKQRASRQELAVVAPPREIRNALFVSHQLMGDGRYQDAEELLNKERKRRPDSPEILEALVDLYQRTDDHTALARVTPELVRLQPRDPEALLIMAQSYLFCGRSAIALQSYRSFLEKWPTHKYASKAIAAIEMLEPEIARELPTYELADSEMHLLVMHDQMMLRMSDHDFNGAIDIAKELLVIKPRLVSVRNNLALCLFHINRMSEALEVAKETMQLFPENRFAEATLGRTLFLLGEFDEANQIADHIATSFAEQQDALAAQAEFLSFLGRDDNIVDLVDFSDSIVEIIPPCRAVLYHYKAVALMRQGHVKEAQAAWKRCLKEDPNCPPAKPNLNELKSAADCHAPWAETLHKWIPFHAMTEIVATLTSGEHNTGSRMPEVLRKWPHLVKLVPAMLDRGDRGAREFALLLAKAVSSPEMLNVLKDFAMGQRGPDAMRISTILFLRQQNFLGDEPVSIWSKGAWTDVVPYRAEIYYEQVPHPNSRVTDLLNVGIDAMHAKDLRSAEVALRQCIKIDPDFPSARHNLAMTLLMGKNKEAHAEAEQILHDVFERFPDYSFARISLAQLAIQEGRIDEAQELIAPLASRTRWHVSEAMAHSTVILELAVARKDFPAAEASLEMMRRLDEDDPRIEQLHRRIQILKNPLAFFSDKFQQITGRSVKNATN